MCGPAIVSLPSNSRGVDMSLCGRQQKLSRTRQLRQTIADLIPRDLFINVDMLGRTPRRVLRHRPILRMVKRPDIDPDIGVPGIEIGDRRPALGAEASLGILGGRIGLERALRQREGGSREPYGRAKEAAIVPPAHCAMTNVSACRGLSRLVAHAAAEAPAGNRKAWR